MPRRGPFSVYFVLSRSAGLVTLLIPLVAAIGRPGLMEPTDYVSHFYVAARLVAEGRAWDLYPDPSATSFTTTPLNTFAHQLLPHLPSKATVIYVYSPLVAWILSPLSRLSPAFSMAAWQLISMVALGACALLLGSITARTWSDVLWMTLLYLPIFHTLFIGHLGIVFGLLPLCAGYVCLLRDRPLWAGLAWSLLLLKPQFIPTVLLMVGVLTLTGRFRCLLGCAAGAVMLVALTTSLLPGLGFRWLAAMKLDDAIFTDPGYTYPVHMVSSLPAVGLHLLPHHLRHTVKLVAYGLAALVGLHALWRSRQLMTVPGPDPNANLPVVLLLGIGVLPVVVPHLIFYDLSILAIAGIIMASDHWSDEEARRLKWINRLYMVVLAAYLVLFAFLSVRVAEPIVLVALLTFLYTRLLGVARIRASATHAALV